MNMKKINLLMITSAVITSIFICISQVNAADDNGGSEAVPQEIFPTEPILCDNDDGGNDAFPEKPFPIEPVLCIGDNEGDE